MCDNTFYIAFISVFVFLITFTLSYICYQSYDRSRRLKKERDSLTYGTDIEANYDEIRALKENKNYIMIKPGSCSQSMKDAVYILTVINNNKKIKEIDIFYSLNQKAFLIGTITGQQKTFYHISDVLNHLNVD